MKLFELHEPPEKRDLQKLKAYLSKPLRLKKPDSYSFEEAQHMASHVLKWATSMSKDARLDLSGADEELKSLIMRFTLTWYKKIVTDDTYDFSYQRKNDLNELKTWIRDLKFSKFPAVEIDALYKTMLKPKKKVEAQ